MDVGYNQFTVHMWDINSVIAKANTVVLDCMPVLRLTSGVAV